MTFDWAHEVRSGFTRGALRITAGGWVPAAACRCAAGQGGRLLGRNHQKTPGCFRPPTMPNKGD